MQEKVYEALIGDGELCGMLGKIKDGKKVRVTIPCIFNSVPESWDELPAVSFVEEGGADAVYADDVCIAKTVLFKVDVWGRTGITKIFERVDAVMRGLGFCCKKAANLPEPQMKHKAAEYFIEIF